jgi:hypothetical protein
MNLDLICILIVVFLHMHLIKLHYSQLYILLALIHLGS